MSLGVRWASVREQDCSHDTNETKAAKVMHEYPMVSQSTDRLKLGTFACARFYASPDSLDVDHYQPRIKFRCPGDDEPFILIMIAADEMHQIGST